MVPYVSYALLNVVLAVCLFVMRCKITHIAKTLGYTLITHQSNTYILEWSLIDIDLRVLAC